MMLGFSVVMMFIAFILPVTLIVIVLGTVILGITKRTGNIPVTPSSQPATSNSPASSCSHCGAGLQTGWTHCPQCGAPANPVAA